MLKLYAAGGYKGLWFKPVLLDVERHVDLEIVSPSTW